MWAAHQIQLVNIVRHLDNFAKCSIVNSWSGTQVSPRFHYISRHFAICNDAVATHSSNGKYTFWHTWAKSAPSGHWIRIHGKVFDTSFPITSQPNKAFKNPAPRSSFSCVCKTGSWDITRMLENPRTVSIMTASPHRCIPNETQHWQVCYRHWHFLAFLNSSSPTRGMHLGSKQAIHTAPRAEFKMGHRRA